MPELVHDNEHLSFGGTAYELKDIESARLLAQPVRKDRTWLIVALCAVALIISLGRQYLHIPSDNVLLYQCLNWAPGFFWIPALFLLVYSLRRIHYVVQLVGKSGVINAYSSPTRANAQHMVDEINATIGKTTHSETLTNS